MKAYLTGIALFLMVGCGSSSAEDKLDTKPSAKEYPEFAFAPSFPDVMEFDQGDSHSYDLAKEVKVPEGEPIMTIENLPANANFDGKVLEWAPSCTMPDDFFHYGYGLHHIRLTVRSSVNPNQYVQRRAVLFVREFVAAPNQKCGQKK